MLWCKSNYSFLEGASHPEELVEKAAELGLPSLALTDRDGIYGVVRAHKRAKELGLHLIIGSTVTLDDDSTLILLAMSRRGYANLCRLLSAGRLRSPKGECRILLPELQRQARDLICLWGGHSASLTQETAPDRMAASLKAAFGDRLYALLTRHHQPDERRIEHRVRERARQFGIEVVAGTEVLYHIRERRPLQDVLTCIRHGITLAAAGNRLRPNAEHALLSPPRMQALYADDPDSLRRAFEVAQRCTFSLNEIRYRYPCEALPDGSSSSEWLSTLTFEGASERYPDGVPIRVKQQLEKELKLIHDLEYDGYFLTMREIIRFCRERDILCQGRGSAANSAVCYCLGITAVDPVRMGFLFERFISRERAEPPDIDLDIEHDRREEVIQHVYQKYGRDHAAMVANIIRYRARSAVREVGKTLGLKETVIERLARVLSPFANATREMFLEAGLDPASPLHRHLLELTLEIQDVPRHLSIHPGGFLLGQEPVLDIVPIENATMENRTVIQWDKDDLEEMGLFKVDLLGLGALNVVHRAFDLVRRHCGRSLTLANIPARDEATFRAIRKADTIGVFQIESRAQMSMLPRLKPRNYYDLVIEVSIVRPGPISGGMVHPFLRRRNGEEPVTYPHPSLEPVLKRTLGIPLFQEQVMKLAVVAADYTPGEADQLRRDMAAWQRSGRIEQHRERLITRMAAKGIKREFAERVFEQIRGFGEYGFPESHAASFALIAYATAWLKTHCPAAFLCALLNAQPMGFYSPATLINDAKRHGVEVRPVDVQVSDWVCGLEPCPGSGEGFAVRMGLSFVKSLHQDEADRILAARQPGRFASLQDFARRTQLADHSLERLAESGAFQAFQPGRRDALWTALGLDREVEPSLELDSRETDTTFTPLDHFETIGWDYEFTDHSPRGHPLAPLREDLSRQNLPEAAVVRALNNGRRVDYAGLVICRQRPGTANGVFFMTLEDETGFVNVVVWERTYEKYRIIAKTASFLGVTGKLQVQSGIVHLVADKLWIPRLNLHPHETKSRDFQ